MRSGTIVILIVDWLANECRNQVAHNVLYEFRATTGTPTCPGAPSARGQGQSSTRSKGDSSSTTRSSTMT
eukprot:1860764-Heterocapsa_arctica.AAC.1